MKVLLENAVFLNLKKYNEVKYYQKRNGPEIDFILVNSSTGFEVKKHQTHTSPEIYNRLLEFSYE